MPELEQDTDINENIDRALRFVTRRRWWIALPAGCVAIATIAVLFLLPNRYSSEATLVVVEQQVPERYVTPTTTTGMTDALQAMTQEVLSRPRLLAIIDEFGLYTKEKQRLAPEEIIELARHYIDVKPLETGRKEVNGFKIAFTAESPRLAQEVTVRLTSLFIQENLKTREDQANNTTNFLKTQVEAVKTRLTQQEQRVRDFKMSNLGELPEQQQGNLQILAGLQTELQNTMAGLSRAQQQQVYLESLISGYRGLAARGASVPVVQGVSRGVSPIEAVQAELSRLQTERATLAGGYTSEHPDIAKLELEISKRQALLESLKSAKPLKAESSQTAPAGPVHAEDDASIAQFRSQLEANRLEVQNLSKEEGQLKAAITRYQDRLNRTPIREQQLAGILRDNELLKKEHADLLSKEQQSQLATSLEKQQGGQQFRLVDPPSLPTLPSSPKRVKISLGGAAAGIVLGLALAIFVEIRHRSFYSEKELTNWLPLPLVLGVPLMLTPREERVRAWKRRAECLAGAVLAVAVFVAEFYTYRHG